MSVSWCRNIWDDMGRDLQVIVHRELHIYRHGKVTDEFRQLFIPLWDDEVCYYDSAGTPVASWRVLNPYVIHSAVYRDIWRVARGERLSAYSCPVAELPSKYM